MSSTSLGSLGPAGGNTSLAWSMGNGGCGRLVLEFPFPLDKGWYQEQTCTEFRTLEHRKERSGFQHEFIVLRLLDGSVCRVERMGDPNARFDALSEAGSTAYDMIQSFQSENDAFLGTSDLVAAVTLPCIFDIIDVLKICRAIHEGAQTRNYTLQVLNCYFFSLAIQACLTRFVAYWEDDGFLEDWISQVQDAVKILADASQSPTPLLERLYYSVLIPPYSRSGCKNSLMQRVQRELQIRMNGLTRREMVKELAHRMNCLLWYSAIDSDLGQVIEEWIRNIVADIIRASVAAMACTGPSTPTATDSTNLKNQLLKIIMEGSTHRNLAVTGPTLNDVQGSSSGTKALKQKPLYELGSNPQRPISELSYNQPPSVQITPAMKVDFNQWLSMSTPYSGLWALRTVLNKWGVVLFAAPDNCAENILYDTLKNLENLESVALSDLERYVSEAHALTRDKVAVWTDNPWIEICCQIQRHVSVDMDKDFAKPKPREQPEIQPVLASAFQSHIFERIKCHANLVASISLQSAAQIKVELGDMLSQVWRFIREDEDISKKTQQILDDDFQGGAPGRYPRCVSQSERGTSSVPMAMDSEPSLAGGLDGDTRFAPPSSSRYTLTPMVPISEPSTSSAPEGIGSDALPNQESGRTVFTSRAGRHVFASPTPTNGALSLVNNWHAHVFGGDTVRWSTEQVVGDPDPTWIAIPIIMNEPNPQYKGSGKSRKEAKEDSARMIMNSGHC